VQRHDRKDKEEIVVTKGLRIAGMLDESGFVEILIDGHGLRARSDPKMSDHPIDSVLGFALVSVSVSLGRQREGREANTDPQSTLDSA